MLVAAGRLDDARARLAEARAVYQSLPDRLGLAAVDNSLGRLELAAAAPVRAFEAHGSALALALEIPNPLEEAEARLGRARALAELGRTVEATTEAEVAREIFTSIGAAGTERTDLPLQALNVHS